MALAVELARAKAALAGLSGTASDAQLTVELAAAEAQVAALCGWPSDDDGVRGFGAGTFTLYPSTSRSEPRLLPLPLEPSTVTTVHSDTSYVYGSGSLVSSSDYTVTRDGLWRTDGGAWTLAPRALKVVCEAGWAAGEAPAEVEAAVVAQLVHRWRVLRPGQGVPSASGRDGSVQRDALTAVPQLVQELAALSPVWRWRAHVG